MVIDIRTLFFVGAVTMIVATITFFGLYNLRRNDKSLLAFSAGAAAITAGFVLFALRGTIPAMVSIVAANTLLPVGHGLIWNGFRSFFGRSVRLVPVLAAACLMGPLLYWFTFVQDLMWVRAVATRLCLAGFSALIWRELTRGDGPRYGRPQRLVGWYYAFLTALNLFFAVAATRGPMPVDFMRAGPPTSIILLIGMGSMVVQIMTVVVLHGERYRHELVAARDAAEAASRAKSRFLAHMSHELRTPLHGLMGMIELARAPGAGGGRDKYLDLAEGSARTLLALISDVLDLSRLEAGKLTVTAKAFALAPALSEVLAPFEHLAVSRGLDFSLRCDPPEAVIVADAAKLRQILLNLVGNALKFTSQGEVTVEARLTAGTAGTGGTGRLTIDVADTGPGIAAEQLEAVFDNFRQTEDGARYGGAGLGLPISRQLARLMGGEVSVLSRPGAGSRFTLVIPCREADPALAEAPFQADERHHVVALSTLPRLRILLADDFEPNLVVMTALLERAGHEVRAVGGGLEAVRAATSERFDLVLMDVGMPGVDGLEAARRIREAMRPAPPIVALTAYALPGDKERFLAEGMDDYLSKPVAMPELVRVLARFAPPGQGLSRREPGDRDAPARSPQKSGLIDWGMALTALEGDRAGLEAYAAVVETQLVDEIGQFARAIQAGDLVTLSLLSHRFRPTLAIFGAEDLAGLAKEVELAAKAGQSDRVTPLAGRLMAGLRDFLLALGSRSRSLEDADPGKRVAGLR